VFLKGDGKGGFDVIPSRLSGFFVPGEVKALSMIHLNDGDKDKAVLVGNNNGRLQIFKFK
jgi:hypothetical protein